MAEAYALRERRHVLKKRLERQDWSRDYRMLAPLLCAAGVRFAKLPPVAIAPLVADIAAAPGRDERILWNEVGGANCAPWSTPAECARLLAVALASLSAPSARIALIIHPAKAGLRISAHDLAELWPTLHEMFYDTLWIVPASGPRGWTVEISYLDRELCAAPSLSATTD